MTFLLFSAMGQAYLTPTQLKKSVSDEATKQGRAFKNGLIAKDGDRSPQSVHSPLDFDMLTAFGPARGPLSRAPLAFNFP